MIAVALIGLDGAGKTTVARELEHRLPIPARYLYMGVNPAAATVSLPTTRVIHAIRRRRGTARAGPIVPSNGPAQPRSRVRSALRLPRTIVATANQIGEETYRLLVARRSMRRGSVVLFDRHFVADFSVVDPNTRRDGIERLHDRIRTRMYRKPDLIVFLDAPADVVFARKGEGTVEWLAERRDRYRRFVEAAGASAAIVDATQPLDAVVEDVQAIVMTAVEGAQSTTAT